MNTPDIYIVRHAQSEGNADPTLYFKKPDHQIELTELGEQQAVQTGNTLADLFKNKQYEEVHVYNSGFIRTLQTQNIAIQQLKSRDPFYQRMCYYQDSRLREQEWGDLQTLENREFHVNKRRTHGSYWYRFPGGESGANVFDRLSSWWLEVRDRFEPEQHWRHHNNNYAMIVFTHGITARILGYRILAEEMTINDFHKWKNLNNGEVVVLHAIQDTTLYRLDNKHQFKHKEQVK